MDINKEKDLKNLEIDVTYIKEALKKLKHYPEFSVYETEIRNLAKQIMRAITSTRLLNDDAGKKILWLQAQFDLIMGIYSITFESVLDEIDKEQLAEPEAE